MRNVQDILLVLIILISHNVSGQVESSLSSRQQKIGIYASYDEYVNNTTSKTVPFKIRQVTKNYEDGSMRFWFNYDVIDSSERPKNVYALFDGLYLYLAFNDTVFNVFQFAGRYPYTIRQTLHVEKSAKWDDTEDRTEIEDNIIYINGKGKSFSATAQSVGVLLLKSDKALLKEFEKEPKYNNAVFLRYLEELNKRHPL